MRPNIDDTNWQTLFWSLMDAIEDAEEVVDTYEMFEQAGLQLEEDELDGCRLQCECSPENKKENN